MLLLVLRRMFNNRWMVVCLSIGTILAVALVSSIPLYTYGIMQRMLTRDLENYQVESGIFPGNYTLKANLTYSYDISEHAEAYKYFNRRLWSDSGDLFGLPVLNRTRDMKLSGLGTQVIGSNGKEIRQYTDLGAVYNLGEHIKITNGRMYSGEAKDGVYEVIVSLFAMKEMNLLLDREYTLTSTLPQATQGIKVKVVGVFTKKEPSDTFWGLPVTDYNQTLLMDMKLLEKDFLDKGSPLLASAQWFYVLDYHKATISNLPGFISQYEEQNKWVQKYRNTLSNKLQSIDILTKYKERVSQLKTMLWVIAIPILIMLTFYIFMVSRVIINHDENSIAVLKSRGASGRQIFASYLLESLIISLLGLAAGPPLGMLLCTVLGSANGFLEFVQRTALPLKYSADAYFYSMGALLFFMATMLIPVIAASRTTIVNHKQKAARGGQNPLWRKIYLDAILLAVSFYGLYGYSQVQKVLKLTGIKSSELKIDPLLFMISIMFILGAGLVFLRIYPFIIRFVYWMGRRIWSPVFYVSLIQIGRSKGQEQFLMLFIILAISTGIFSANSARTINRNIEDKIKYRIGADVTLMALWESNENNNSGMPSDSGGNSSWSSGPVIYYEPEYRSYSTLAGTETATKVLINEKAQVQLFDRHSANVRVMGIIPDEFAKVAWFRSDLLKAHWFHYINLIADAPKALLLSSNLKEKLGAKEGDIVSISLGNQNYIEGMIYAFVDYWPSYNPNPAEKGVDAPGLVVANYNYIRDMTGIQPYQVWIRKKPDASDKEMNDDITQKNLRTAKIDYTTQELIKMKNDPLLQGINGSLTLGFVGAMAISTLGFLIYWIISIQNRVLHFGILRAMGLSLAKVIGMIACEQVLVSGAAIVAGIVTGGIAANLFIPLLQIVYSAADQVPPFRIIAYQADYIKIYIVIGVMLAVGFITLWRIITHIRIDQAVKLGED